MRRARYATPDAMRLPFAVATLFVSLAAAQAPQPPVPPALAADEPTLNAVQRYRTAHDPAEARRAFDELRARAATSPAAALACGFFAARPGSVAADRDVARSCLTAAAQAGVPEAQYQLALLLLAASGPGAPEQHAEAERWLGRAAPSSPESVYLLAKRRAQREASPDALSKVVDEAARVGYGPAQRELAHRSMTEGKRDEALGWLEKASAQGDAEAAYELATLVAEQRRDGDVPRVIALLEQSAGGGSARGALALGLRLLNADGLKRDTERAYGLIRQAAIAGLPEGQYALGYVLMDGLGTSANEALGLKWHEAAASQGHRDAMYALGNAHANGWGTGKSMDMAYRWYCRAAQAGQEAALKLVSGSSLGRDCVLPTAAGQPPGPSPDPAAPRPR